MTYTCTGYVFTRTLFCSFTLSHTLSHQWQRSCSARLLPATVSCFSPFSLESGWPGKSPVTRQKCEFPDQLTSGCWKVAEWNWLQWRCSAKKLFMIALITSGLHGRCWLVWKYSPFTKNGLSLSHNAASIKQYFYWGCLLTYQKRTGDIWWHVSCAT